MWKRRRNFRWGKKARRKKVTIRYICIPCKAVRGVDFDPQPEGARGLDFLFVAGCGLRARIRPTLRGEARRGEPNDYSCGAGTDLEFQPAQFGHLFILFVPVNWGLPDTPLCVTLCVVTVMCN